MISDEIGCNWIASDDIRFHLMISTNEQGSIEMMVNNEDLLRALFLLAAECCGLPDGHRDDLGIWHHSNRLHDVKTAILDSNYRSAYAHAIRTLAEAGLVTITSDDGMRSVEARVTEAGLSIEKSWLRARME